MERGGKEDSVETWHTRRRVFLKGSEYIINAEENQIKWGLEKSGRYGNFKVFLLKCRMRIAS